ncbi:MAG: NAD(P)/FAD-dependent oxidoreductase [Rhodospirillales bacterium]
MPLDDRSPYSRPLKIAVIGTGIAGMSAAGLLSKSHDVTVYERGNRIGGHSNTVDTENQFGTTPVDTGFIVYNELNYPNLTALFSHLNVPTKESEMSFAASLDDGAFEYGGSDIPSMIAQKRNLLRPKFWRMLLDLRRFYQTGPELLSHPHAEDISLGDFLDQGQYSDSFIYNHLLPMGAAIWSTAVEEMRDHPALTFVRFCMSHGLMQVANRPQWRTVDGGSREYVRRLTASYADNVQLNCGARKIHRFNGGKEVMIEDDWGHVSRYDRVVIATHADQALSMLGDPSVQERTLLGAFRYTQNTAVLHTDSGLMPKRKAVWSSWNYLSPINDRNGKQVNVTYWMNRLQGIDERTPLFVTLNPHRDIEEQYIKDIILYEHPFYDYAAIKAQRQLWQLQSIHNTWYCGSYFGYGFHEDALQSGLAAAEAIGGVRRPWTVEDESGRIHLTPEQELAA